MIGIRALMQVVHFKHEESNKDEYVYEAVHVKACQHPSHLYTLVVVFIVQVSVQSVYVMCKDSHHKCRFFQCASLLLPPFDVVCALSNRIYKYIYSLLLSAGAVVRALPFHRVRFLDSAS